LLLILIVFSFVFFSFQKTFSIHGGTSQFAHRGLTPRSLHDLFSCIASRSDLSVQVRVSYLEIYGDSLFDLLAPIIKDKEKSSSEELNIMEDESGAVQVKNLCKPIVHSETEALRYLFEGESNRTVSRHRLNQSSTRSHCVFSVHLEIRSLQENSEKIIKAKLDFVDLAGSERLKKSQKENAANSQAVKEAKAINQSLSFLEHVVVTMSKSNREHQPFRQSKLTNLLRDCLGGHHRTRLIACIYTEAEHLEETISSLRFSTRMGKITNKVNQSFSLDPRALIEKQKKEIKAMKQELAIQEQLNHHQKGGKWSMEPFTPEEIHGIRVNLLKFLIHDREEEMEIPSLRHMKEILSQMKRLSGELGVRADLEGIWIKENSQNIKQNEETNGNNSDQTGQNNTNANAGTIGELDSAMSGFSIGVAPASAAPASKAKTNKHSDSPSSKKSGTASLSLPVLPSSAPVLAPVMINSYRAEEKTPSVASPVRTQRSQLDSYRKSAAPTGVLTELDAFKQFKEVEGRELAAAYESNKAEERARKRSLRELNQQIGELKAELNSRPAEAPEAQKTRESLQVALQEVKTIKEELSGFQQMAKSSQLALCESFLSWSQSLNAQGKSEKSKNNRNINQNSSAAAEYEELKKKFQLDDDELDDGEKFDMLEAARVAVMEPESLSFYYAQKESEKMKRLKKVTGKKPVSQSRTKFY
jgi:kinesin family protein 6/9